MVLVETVGVGQSETTVAGMVDTFLLLGLARAGDQLQGIKKGVLEIADVVAINKADGEHALAAKAAARELAGALRLVHSGGARLGAPGAHLLGADRRRRHRVVGDRSAGTARSSARKAWRPSDPPSSGSSPGRWSGTSWTSGCAGPPRSPRRPTPCGAMCSPAACPPLPPPTPSSPPTTTPPLSARINFAGAAEHG